MGLEWADRMGIIPWEKTVEGCTVRGVINDRMQE